MRKLYVLSVIAAISVLWSGCSKKSSNATFMSATVNSSGYSVPGCIISLSTDTSASATTTLIDGFVQTSTKTTYPYVILSLKNWLWAEGNVNLDNTKGCYALYYTSTGFAKKSTGGSVVINNVGRNTVSGTFSFTCEDGTTVTNGSFSAKRP